MILFTCNGVSIRLPDSFFAMRARFQSYCKKNQALNSSDRPNIRGKIWAEIWNEGVHATQIPTSQSKNLLSFDRSNRGLKVRWARKRKPERGYTFRLDSHVNPAINSCNRRRENGKKRDASRKNPKRGAVCHSDIYFIQLLWLLILIGQTEGRKKDV